MLVLIILSCGLPLPCFELTFEFLIALVVLLTLILVFPFLMIFSTTIKALGALLFIHIEKIFISQSVPSLIGFETIEGSREFLELGLVACALHIWVINLGELEVDALEFTFRQSLAQV